MCELINSTKSTKTDLPIQYYLVMQQQHRNALNKQNIFGQKRMLTPVFLINHLSVDMLNSDNIQGTT